jgi:hypothetical protein
MTNSRSPLRAIQFMRMIRPFIDMLILGALVALFIYLQHLPSEQRPTISVMPPASTITKAQPLTYIEIQHESEEAMWNAFSLWFAQSGSGPGHCRFESNVEQGTQKYQMLCAGKPVGTSPQHAKALEADVQLSHVFATQKAVSVSSREKLLKPAREDQKSAEPKRVQGWVNTTSGKKEFNPVLQRWVD